MDSAICHFRKKPIIIAAMQFTGKNCYDILSFIGREDLKQAGLHELQQTDNPVIPTLEGDMVASAGDWIIKGVKDEFYPCKPDIMAKSYDPVDEDGEPIERCEGGCLEPVTNHDVEGVPLCQKCWDALGRETHASRHNADVEIDP